MSITTTPSEHKTTPTPHGRRKWPLPWVLALVVATASAAVAIYLLAGSEDDLPVLENGDFEAGDFTGWSTESWGKGEWLIYDDGLTPPKPSITDTGVPFDVPDPPQGQYAAVTDMDYSGVRFLYRDIEVTGPWTLHAVVFYDNTGGAISDPPEFGRFDGEVWFSGSGIRNQQFRIDLIDPESTIYSLESDDILGTMFRTQLEDPQALEPTPVTIDLSPWEGQTVRLRAAQIDNTGALRAGIDDVRLERAD